MPLTTFIATEAVTHTRLNALVNDLPKVMVHFLQGSAIMDTAVGRMATLATTYPTTPQFKVLAAPLVGDYLRVLMELATDATRTVFVSVRLARAGVEVELFNSSVVGTTMQVVSSVQAITALGALGNLGCEDAEIRLYFKGSIAAQNYQVRNLLLVSGTVASLSLYLE